jgi:hypothetical protein
VEGLVRPWDLFQLPGEHNLIEDRVNLYSWAMLDRYECHITELTAAGKLNDVDHYLKMVAEYPFCLVAR